MHSGKLIGHKLQSGLAYCAKARRHWKKEAWRNQVHTLCHIECASRAACATGVGARVRHEFREARAGSAWLTGSGRQAKAMLGALPTPPLSARMVDDGEPERSGLCIVRDHRRVPPVNDRDLVASHDEGMC